ncbi:MAG: O-antigen ligase family protein [Gemmatimonadetes bacterium]|nr:O-antigen ligase family protein [Gemmatimonadota bacterium]
MSFDLGRLDPATRPASIELTPLTRFVLIVLMLGMCVYMGAMFDVTMLVMALGLFNVGVVVFLLLRKDITWGFLFYLVTVIFFQTGFWIRLPGFPDLYPARIVSMLLFLVFFIQIMLGIRRVPKLGPIEKTMIVFMVVMFISIITSGQKPRWLLIMRGYIYPFMFFYFARAVVNRIEQIRIVLWFLAVLGIYFAVMGIFEKMKWYGLVWPRFIVDPTLRDHGLTRLGFRVRGIFLQPAVLGTVMTMGFFPAWHYMSHLRGIPPVIVRLVLIVTTPATIFFTQTRSCYVGFLAALLVVAGWSRRMRPMAVGVILAGMVGVFLNWGNLSSEDREKGGLGQLNTIHYRVSLALEALEMFVDHPFFGVGFMNMEEAIIPYRRPRDVPIFGHIDLGTGHAAVSHNILITVLAEQGILGLAPYVLIYFLLIRAAQSAYRSLPARGVMSREYVVCVMAAFMAYFVNAMALEMRYFEYVNVLFFFLLGSLLGVSDRLEQDQAAAAEAAGEPVETPVAPRLVARRAGA